MFVNAQALQEALLDFDPNLFVSHFLFDCTPFVFGRNQSSWIDWKHLLAHNIDIDARDVVLVGSAALGYSLSPNKAFRPFGAHSDFDCGIVSPYYFDVAWRYLRKLNVDWLTLPSKQKRAIDIHRKSHIFMGTIATNSMLSILPFGREWQGAIDIIRRVDPTHDRDVKLRIYKDYDALRYYHSANIEGIRDRLQQISFGVKDGESTIEDEQ